MMSYDSSNLEIWKGYKTSFCRSGHIFCFHHVKFLIFLMLNVSVSICVHGYVRACMCVLCMCEVALARHWSGIRRLLPSYAKLVLLFP